MITDRLRWTVIECNSDIVLARDLIVKEPHVRINLSAPCTLDFKIDKNEQQTSSYGIQWKNRGQIVVCEIEIDGEQFVFGAGIVIDNQVDRTTGDLTISCLGYMGYLKDIPFLENFNPITVDPFEIIQRLYAHVQSFSNANLNASVTPSSSGTQMLPGFGFNGSILNFDFYAVFYRASDLSDCFDIATGLARDIPFDMIETPYWNVDKTELNKGISLGYPQGGLQQDHLAFRVGENVIDAEKAEELQIEPVTDVIIRGWLPGKVYSAQLSNSDPTRLRTTILEDDAMIDSTERAAAWAKRKLTRRNIPISFQEINIDPNHPNAPFGSFWVGDSIPIYGKDYPWYGDISGLHRVTYIDYDEVKGEMKVGVKSSGAWNYDPIIYDPDVGNHPVTDLNRLPNGYFANNLAGWASIFGQWFRTTLEPYGTVYNSNPGSVRIDCDDAGEIFQSSAVFCAPGEDLRLQCAVKYEDMHCPGGISGIELQALHSLNGDTTGQSWFIVDNIIAPNGSAGWTMLQDPHYTVPGGVNEIRFRFAVTAPASNPVTPGGICWWTYARIVPASSPGVPT